MHKGIRDVHRRDFILHGHFEEKLFLHLHCITRSWTSTAVGNVYHKAVSWRKAFNFSPMARASFVVLSNLHSMPLLEGLLYLCGAINYPSLAVKCSGGSSSVHKVSAIINMIHIQ